MTKLILVVALLAATASPAAAQFDKLLKGLGSMPGGGGGLSDAKIGSGLQEALKVGTENARCRPVPSTAF